MRNFPTIQIDRLKFLGAYSIGHAGQGIIGEGELTLRRHYHGNQYELTCILEGEGTSYHGNTPQHVQAGDIYVSFPLEYHKIEVTPGTIMRQCFVTFSVNSGKYFEKYQQKTLGMTAEVLPSTSPANAAFGLEKLTAIWSEALKDSLG